MLQDDSRYFPAFRMSQLYIRLLAELDLLREPDTALDDGTCAQPAFLVRDVTVLCIELSP